MIPFDIISVCVASALALGLLCFELGVRAGRRSGAALGRIRLQPQLDRANELNGDELEKVIAFAYKFADNESKIAGRYSPALLRFLRELEGRRK